MWISHARRLSTRRLAYGCLGAIVLLGSTADASAGVKFVVKPVNHDTIKEISVEVKKPNGKEKEKIEKGLSADDKKAHQKDEIIIVVVTPKNGKPETKLKDPLTPSSPTIRDLVNGDTERVWPFNPGKELPYFKIICPPEVEEAIQKKPEDKDKEKEKEKEKEKDKDKDKDKDKEKHDKTKAGKPKIQVPGIDELFEITEEQQKEFVKKLTEELGKPEKK